MKNPKTPEELGKEIKYLEAQISSFHKEIEARQGKIRRLKVKLDKFSDELLQSKLSPTLTDDSNIADMLRCTWDESTKRYRLREKFFEEKYRGFIHNSGFYDDIEQVAIYIKILKESPNKDLDFVESSLLELLKHMKPLKDGKKRIHIMENTLSEHGIYELEVQENFAITITVYGRRKVLKEFPNLREALEHIRGNLYMD